tara:strand:- start:446 stop:640 length:195 start_codon:yes stop_codon:yes gene_type:complete
MTTQKDVNRAEKYVKEAKEELESFESEFENLLSRHTFLIHELLAAEEEYRYSVLELEFTAGEEE